MISSRTLSGTLPGQQAAAGAGGHPTSTPEPSPRAHRTGLAEGSADAHTLSLLYERFRRPIYAYAYRMLGNPDDAADVTQDVFLRAYTAWERLRDHDHLGVWLQQVATHLCIDLLRRRRRLSWYPLARRPRQAAGREGRSEEETYSYLPPDSGGIPAIAEREHIHLAFAHMPADYALILVMSAVEGRSYQEIATLLGLEPSVTATRIWRAKKLFVEQYQRLSQDGVEHQEREQR